MSDFFDASGNRISDGVTARAADVNTLRDEVGAGFDLLPDVANINSGTVNYAVDTGVVNAYLVSLPQAPASYTDGLHVVMRPLNTNTGASTINVNSLGVKSIRGTDSAALQAGYISAGVPCELRYSTATGYFHLSPNSAAAATSAASSATSAAASYDNFDDRYLGSKSSAPTVDNDGNPLLTGALYWSTGANAMYVYDGAAWQAVGVPISWTGNIAKNAVINGGMMVAQRGDLTLGSAAPAANAGYGKVDRFQCWGTGTAVSAGTATQDTASGIGRTGYALKLSGVTITGTGIVFCRHRIEAKNSLRFKNQVASLSAVVKHDVGSAINYTLTVRKANTADTFSATTTIQTGSATSVANATETTIKLENISMGDCSNGIEIEVKAECGAITTKNFWLTELQLELGTGASAFDHTEFGATLSGCQRYFEKSFPMATAPAETSTLAPQYSGYAYSTTSGYSNHIPFKARKRSGPTMVYYRTATGQWTIYYNGATSASVAVSNNTVTEEGFSVNAGSLSTTAGYSLLLEGHWTAAAEL